MKSFHETFRTVDGLLMFNPSQWPHRERIGRMTALGCVCLFLWVKWYRFDSYPGVFEAFERFFLSVNAKAGILLYPPEKIVILWTLRVTSWLAETGTLLGYLVAYTVRKEARVPAAGIRETVLPVVIAAVPVLISMTPYTFPAMVAYTSPLHYPLFVSVSAVILLGTVINLWALITLRRCFAIMPEARGLVTTGLFRFVRHPIYLGHFILMSGVVIIRLNWYTVVLFCLFLLGQYWRARVEEEKLLSAIPGYDRYRSRTGMFFPTIKF